MLYKADIACGRLPGSQKCDVHLTLHAGLRLQLPSLERASLHLGHTSYAYVTITKPCSASLHSAKKTIDVAGMHRYNRVYPKAEVSTILAKYIIDNAVHKI